MQQSIPTILSLAELFDSLTKTQLELVASICEPATYESGSILIQENEASDELYVIGRGKVAIIMNPSFVSAQQDDDVEPVVVAELSHGQVFGEIALVDQGIRSATARVSQDSSYILRIPRKRLMLLCDTYPDLGYKLMKNLAADMAMKMRNTDLTVRYYQLKLADAESSEE
jgi:CRP-like cAMP-binding protein